MNKDIRNKIIVGAFASIGMAIFIIGIYFVGSKKNMFSNTFTLTVSFNDVNGLETGNNVRFRGVDVGTIKSIDIQHDSVVIVTLMIESKIKPFIKKNAFVSIGTDGLMGNKVAIIQNSDITAKNVDEGDILVPLNPIASEDIIRSLGGTSKNITAIIDNLKAITDKINNSTGIWKLLNDSSLDNNLKQTIINVKLISAEGTTVVSDLCKITKHVKEGKGILGTLLIDTSLESSLKQSLVNIHTASDKMVAISGDLSIVSGKIKNGEGALGTLIMDTSFAGNLNQSMKNINNSSKNLNEDLEGFKHSFLLKKYFKKQAKENK